MTDKILEVIDLKKYFPIKQGVFSRTVNNVKAVDGVDFSIIPGETLGLVGESGCGKTTLGRTILRLQEPTAGKIIFENQDICKLNNADMRILRREMQIIFQDPYGSLNPRMTVGDIIGEPFDIHGLAAGEKRQVNVHELLEVVGLKADHITRYPHEFSGGQRQRIVIARGLALRPKLIICDESVSALDVSIQAQILNLLKTLQKQFNLTYLFIAHDLSVVKHISDRIAVMYLGKLVEIARKDELYNSPCHPYTKALLSAIPIPRPGARKSDFLLEGDVPSPVDPPHGCRFHTRCPVMEDLCRQTAPELVDIGDRHFCACHKQKAAGH
ncbi:MAG: dipeptide ABC transporter ATP-binding protein [Desulfobacteraceae bacterium]|nr:dipeptide ABC transporter ATP-binding protein [Desulfobacteraceae bacterium]